MTIANSTIMVVMIQEAKNFLRSVHSLPIEIASTLKVVKINFSDFISLSTTETVNWAITNQTTTH